MEYKILEEMFNNETPASVFEIGCANGGLLRDLRSKYPDIRVGGMDISKSIDQCKSEFGPDNFYWADLNDTPWPIPDKSYDIVFSVGVLMYMFDPLSVLREMFRISKKVILAEYHHSQVDLCGQLTKGYIEDGKIQTGIIRDYISLFKVMNMPMTLTYQESSAGKTIFKAQLT